MSGAWRLVITGCGTSHGNPPWGYPDLWSEDPRDQRRRSGAILLGPAGEVVLIDTGPDLQHQLRDPYKRWDGRSYPADCITRCDGVFITHEHADHTHGLNELRHLNRLMDGRGITLYGEGEHLAGVRAMYGYCFGDGSSGGYRLAAPMLRTQTLTDGRSFELCGLDVTSFPMSHGPSGRVTGLRFGRMAYCTDCKVIPPESMAYLHDLDLLVLDMLRAEAHVSHFNWDEAAAVIAELQPRRTVLVHMGYEVRYHDWSARLPEGVEMAYDGWTATFVGQGPRWPAGVAGGAGVKGAE